MTIKPVKLNLRAHAARGTEGETMKKTVLVLLCAAFASGVIFAADGKPSPVSVYKNATDFSIIGCQITFKTAMLNRAIDTFYKCIDDGKNAVKTAYTEASGAVSSDPAKAALKEHYIKAISTLQSIDSYLDEGKGEYERRQGENKAKLRELWIRFEAENL